MSKFGAEPTKFTLKVLTEFAIQANTTSFHTIETRINEIKTQDDYIFSDSE